jgi:hypothetical protein
MQMFFTAAMALIAITKSQVSAAPLQPRQVSSNCNIDTYQLTASLPFIPPYTQIMYTNLMFSNNSVFIGQVRYQQTSEPLIISAESGFTSQHQAPTGFTSAYLYPGQTTPLQFTLPHSGAIPAGASPVGFNFTGNLWGVNGTTDAWTACPVAYAADGNWTIAQIFYEGGAKNSSCTSVNLTQYVYGHPSASGTEQAF